MYAFSFRRLRRFPLLWWTAVSVIAIVIGLFVSQSVAHSNELVRRYGPTVDIYIASHKLSAGTVVGNGDVRSVSFPKSLLPESAVVTTPIGKTITIDVDRSEPIVASKVGRENLSPTAALLQPEEVAVSIPRDERSLEFQIGDLVDLYATFNSTDGSTEPPTTLVANRTRVVHVSESSVTIAVSRESAPKVAFAVTKGTVTPAITAAE